MQELYEILCSRALEDERENEKQKREKIIDRIMKKRIKEPRYKEKSVMSVFLKCMVMLLNCTVSAS